MYEYTWLPKLAFPLSDFTLNDLLTLEKRSSLNITTIDHTAKFIFENKEEDFEINDSIPLSALYSYIKFLVNTIVLPDNLEDSVRIQVYNNCIYKIQLKIANYLHKLERITPLDILNDFGSKEYLNADTMYYIRFIINGYMYEKGLTIQESNQTLLVKSSSLKPQAIYAESEKLLKYMENI